jgi:hypothetical protein
MLLAASCVAIAGAIATLPAFAFDSMLLNGDLIWHKPMKFWLAVSMHFATLGLLLRLAPMNLRRGWLIRLTVPACVIAGFYETLYITAQAARGRASHFNYSTPTEGVLYQVMGLGAVTLVVSSVIVGILIARSPGRWSGLRLGAVLGLVAGSILTLIVAGTMSSQPSHYFGMAHASDAGALPLVGWSFALPDLRPAHFFSTHMMQILPFAGVSADLLAPRHARRVVLVTGLLLTSLTIGLFVRAVVG